MSSLKRNSSNYLDADYTLIRRCMAVILIPLSNFGFDKGDSQRSGDRTRTNSSTSLGLELCNGISEGPGPPEEQKKCPGPEVFADFIKENSECYWNPCLVQSVRNLEYRGCVAPSTVLISGTDYSLEVVRSAWARRILKAPCGYDISMIGDLDPVKMAVVAQTHFAPLPEALCKVVYDLNKEGTVANMGIIGSRLKATFPEIVLPEENVLYRALGALIHERKLFHTGQGYSVVTPDTFRLLAMSPPVERQMLLTNEEAIVRLHGTAVTEGRTACTQTNQRDSTLTTWSSAERILSPSSRNQSHQGKLKRCHSLKLLQRGRDKEKVFRSNSFRSSKGGSATESKSDVENIDPSIKKEKSSMFSKWFRRGRDKKSTPKSSTVSSQFPPRDRSDPDFVLYNSRATQTLDRNERLPPKSNKSRASSLNRASGRERHSQYLSSTPVTPKASQRNGHYHPQITDIYHYRSSSLPRKSCPSPDLELSRNSTHHHPVANRKPSPKPPTRQRQHQTNASSRVPITSINKSRPHYESHFSPITGKSNEMLADDKYEETMTIRQTGSAWPCRQNTSNVAVKPTLSVPSRNPTPPWRMLSNPPPIVEPKIGIGEPMKPLSVGLPQRIVTREIASVPPSTANPVAKPQVIKTSESIVTTETVTPKKGLHIDGSVDVEINLGQILSNQHKPGLLNTDLDNHSKSDLLKIAASWNQSLTNNQKSNVTTDKNGRNQTLSTTTSVKTSVSHGGLKSSDLKTETVEVNSPDVTQGPVKVLKSTTVVDCTGKCTIVGELPKSESIAASPRSKLAEAKRDFFAESPIPTEPVSLKDDSGFSSSTSTSRPMSVSPC